MTRAGASLVRRWARLAGSPSVRQRWCAVTALGAFGAFAVFGSGSTVPPIPSLPAPGTTGPIDRTTVAMPPVYPAPGPGFLRLPDTRVAPVPSPAAALPGGGLAGSQVQSSPLPGQWPGVLQLTQDRPVWTPARLEPVVGLDANGRVTSILEYTPGRFEH
jgi:hypothetical protein